MGNHRVTVVLTPFHRKIPRPIALLAALLIALALLPARTPTASAETDATVNMRPGSVFRDKLRSGGEGPAMVVIPAGKFRMGDLSGRGYRSNEKPVHDVRIARPFAMGKYEVTFAEYDHFAQATGMRNPDDEGYGRGNHPVIRVSWEDAQAYAEWLSKETGKRYRLPSEAEWEYAARAGSTTKYFWGNRPSGRHANGDDGHRYGDWPKDGHKYTAPVGSFLPNQFGLYDMSGNVWEWTEDCWHEGYEGAPADGSAWVSGYFCETQPFRVIRGGSFGNTFAGVRSANRHGYRPNADSWRIGFRLVRTL